MSPQVQIKVLKHRHGFYTLVRCRSVIIWEFVGQKSRFKLQELMKRQ